MNTPGLLEYGVHLSTFRASEAQGLLYGMLKQNRLTPKKDQPVFVVTLPEHEPGILRG